MKRIVVLFMLAAMTFHIGCDKDDHKDDRLKKLDIVNANSLFIASNNLKSSSLKSSFHGSKLFKITEAGYIEEVTYYNEEGNETIYEYYPTNIYNVCEDYVIVIFGGGATGYLVRKSDGAVFTLGDVGIPLRAPYGTYLNWPPVQIDANNNVYYLISEFLGEDFEHGAIDKNRVVKIRLDNPARLTAEFISPTEEDMDFFFVNHSGDVFYDGMGVSHPRIIMAGGGLVNAPQNVNQFWLGADGVLYGNQFRGHNYFQILQLQIVNNELIVEEYGNNIEWGFFTDHSTILNLHGKVYVATDGGEVFEVYNPTATPQQVKGLGMISFHNVAASDHNYYLSGNNEAAQPTLLKVYAQTNSPETLLTPNQYDIYAMTVSHDDNVTFSALRMSDGKKVIGEISASGELSILDEELDSNIIVLERIN